jgi:DNA-directed RNA polymerase subunit RPC12/RpoP
MFLAHCTRCSRRELRSVRAITRLANTPDGIEVGYRCSACGARQRMLTGAHAPAAMLRAS